MARRLPRSRLWRQVKGQRQLGVQRLLVRRLQKVLRLQQRPRWQAVRQQRQRPRLERPRLPRVQVKPRSELEPRTLLEPGQAKLRLPAR
jgi:hypothetical protein